MFKEISKIKIKGSYGIKLKTPNTAITLLDNYVDSLEEILNVFHDSYDVYYLIDNDSWIHDKFHLGLRPNEFVVVSENGDIYTIRPCDDKYEVNEATVTKVKKDYDSDYIRMKVKIFSRTITVSRLVACCFQEMCGKDLNGYYEVHHINMDPTDNHASNLIFLDRKTHKKLHKAFNRMGEEDRQEKINDLIDLGKYGLRLISIDTIITFYLASDIMDYARLRNGLSKDVYEYIVFIFKRAKNDKSDIGIATTLDILNLLNYSGEEKSRLAEEVAFRGKLYLIESCCYF